MYGFINNSTFHYYNIINRAFEDLSDAYFAIWMDPDLGCGADDYIGSSPANGLSYIYNSDEVDGTSGCYCNYQATYCDNVPILGYDFLFSPQSKLETDTVVHIDFEVDTTVFSIDSVVIISDTSKRIVGHILLDTRFSSFTYSRSGSGHSNSDGIQGAYNQMRGLWPNGEALTRFETGDADDVTSYAYDGTPNDLETWSLCSEGSPGRDFRTLQSSGPFYLRPGQVVPIYTGIYWLPNLPDYPCPSIRPLLKADSLAQLLFNDCFRFETVVSLDEKIKQNEAIVFPNPTYGIIYIKMDDFYSNSVDASIYNTEGKILFRKQHILVNDNVIQLDLTALSTGVHIVKLTDVNYSAISKIYKY